jgi:hypothetical protein
MKWNLTFLLTGHKGESVETGGMYYLIEKIVAVE